MIDTRKAARKRLRNTAIIVLTQWAVYGALATVAMISECKSDRITLHCFGGEAWLSVSPFDYGFTSAPPPPAPNPFIEQQRIDRERLDELSKRANSSGLTESEFLEFTGLVRAAGGSYRLGWLGSVKWTDQGQRARVVELLCSYVQSGDLFNRAEAALQLGLVGEKEKMPEVLNLLAKAQTTGEAKAILQALNSFSMLSKEPGLADIPDPKGAVQLLRHVLLRSKEYDIQVMVIFLLGQIGPRAGDAVPEIVRVRYDKLMFPPGKKATPPDWYGPYSEREFDEKVIHSLRLIGIAAVPHLAAALKESDTSTRRRAATALGEIGPSARSAVPRLRELVNDPDPQVREAAGEALKKMK